MNPVVTYPPASGEVPTGDFTLRWTDDEPRGQYYISIGSTFGGSNLLDVTLPGNSGAVPYDGSHDVTGLPLGAVAYMAFWFFDSTWHEEQFAFYVRAAERSSGGGSHDQPTVTFDPPSGTGIPKGFAQSITWSGLPGEATATLFVGTAASASDLLVLPVGLGDPSSSTLPTALLVGGRVYLSFVVTWDGQSWLYAAGYPIVDADLAVETLVRRLVGTYWLEAWMGPALDERRLCPARVLGFAGEEIDFAVEDPADVAPWTPAEVRASVGYALLTMRESDRFDVGITSGQAAAGTTAQEYRLYALEFELAVPSKLKGADPVERLEARAAEVERLFRGVTMAPDRVSVLSLRNLARYPTRRRAGGDDGTWRRTYVTVLLRARTLIYNAGDQEVPLP